MSADDETLAITLSVGLATLLTGSVIDSNLVMVIGLALTWLSSTPLLVGVHRRPTQPEGAHDEH